MDLPGRDLGDVVDCAEGFVEFGVDEPDDRTRNGLTGKVEGRGFLPDSATPTGLAVPTFAAESLFSFSAPGSFIPMGLAFSTFAADSLVPFSAPISCIPMGLALSALAAESLFHVTIEVSTLRISFLLTLT